MVKTGGSLFIALSLAVMMMPLLPLCLLFIRKAALTAILNVLRILCGYLFLQHLFTNFILPQNGFIQTGSQLIEFILVLYLFKLMLIRKRAREVMNMCLVSFLSVLTTIYTLRGMSAFPRTITLVQALILLLMAIVVLVQLIGNRHIVLLNEPVFWIAGGVVSYYGMVMLMELVAAPDTDLSQQIRQEKDLVLLGTDLIRFTFFSIAASVAPVRQ